MRRRAELAVTGVERLEGYFAPVASFVTSQNMYCATLEI